MYLLNRTAKICHHNVANLCSPSPSLSSSSSASSSLQLPLFTTFTCLRRLLSTGQWKKYLNVLDVNKSSTPKDIKTSFLKLSKVYHPDNKLTGSHTKFVELKEAYDALKDGHPTTTTHSDTTTTTSRSYRYNNYYDTDVRWEAHRDYRERYREYQTEYEQKNWGFGGPYKYSDQPWEDLKRDRMYRRQQAYEASFPNRGKGSTLISLTIVLSAMAWIVIYSSVLLIWDYKDSVHRGITNYKARNHEDYVAYQEYVKKKEAARLAKMERIRIARENERAKMRAAERAAAEVVLNDTQQPSSSAPVSVSDIIVEETPLTV